MSKRVIGSLEVQGNLQINGKYAMRFFNGVAPDANTGNVTYPSYSKSEVDAILGMLPVSRIGTMDYLPLNINGSFVGSTVYDSKKVFPTLLEDDGTLVYIKPGTNGSSAGFYYSYVPDARNSVSMQPILTNTPYVPSFFTPQHKLINFIGSNEREVLMMRTNNGTKNTYTLALTNGTMNSVSHQYIEFDRSLIQLTDPQYAMICDNYVHIWCVDSYENSAQFSMTLYYISVANIIAGVPSLVRHSGITGKTLYGEDVTNDSAFIFATQSISSSTNVNSKPMVKLVSDGQWLVANMFQFSGGGMVHAQKSSSQNEIRVSIFNAYNAVSEKGTTPQKTWGFSFVFNRTAKTYTYDTTSLAPIIITASGDTITSTTQFDLQMTNINGFNDTQGNVPTISQTDDGTVFSTIARYITSPDHKLTRSKVSNFTNLYDSWNLTTRVLNSVSTKYVYPIYGSALGENLINPQLIAPNKFLLFSSGTYNGTTYSYDGTVTAEISGDKNYSYGSINGPSINGYAPNFNRVQIDNIEYKYNGLITLVQNDGTTKVYGSTFIEGVNKKAYGLLDPVTMQFTGQYTLNDDNVLGTLKTNMISSVTIPGTVLQSTIAVYYIPDESMCKSIAVVSLRTDETGINNTHVISSEIDVNITGTVIQGFTILSSFHNVPDLFSTNISYAVLERMSGLTVAKYSDFTYLGFASLADTRTTSNANFRSLLGKIDNSTKRISSPTLTIFGSEYVSSAGGGGQVGIIPNVGFGIYVYGPITDLGTKLVFKNFGTTSAQFDTMVSNLGADGIEKFVVLAQEVPQGYNVYFTQEVPVFLGGRYYKLPTLSLDLSTIKANPANSTFYIYVEMDRVASVASYVVTESLFDESLTRTYIGTIVTGASGISTINSEKVTRYLTYRPSTVKRGSAIPVSTGVPSGSGTRWH